METLQRFPVFESYANSIKTLYTWDKALAGELSYWVIQYGIYGTPPPKNTNPVVLALFEQIRLAIDKGRKQIINGNKGWRQPKTWENLQKPNTNPTLTQPKPNTNPTDNKIENNKIENNSIEDTNIITLSGNKANASYGNSEVNECMELIKKFNGGITNGSDKKQRQYATNLIKKLQKFESVEAGRYTRQEVLQTILQIVSNDPYHSAKISSPELIYYNLASLLQVCKKAFTSQNVGQKKLQAI